METPTRLEKPYLVVRLLSSLKGFCTFKELEEELDVPAQMLWRYTSLHNIPEKKTAVRILRRIQERKLLERVYRRVVVKNSYGYIDAWRYIYDRHFLGLAGYEAVKFLDGVDVNVVLTYPPDDAPLAVEVSEWLKCRVCVASREAPLSPTGFLYHPYASLDRGAVVTIYVPKGALRRGDRILLVKNIVKNWDSLHALSNLAEKVGGQIVGALVIASISSTWKEACKKYNIERVRVLRELS